MAAPFCGSPGRRVAERRVAAAASPRAQPGRAAASASRPLLWGLAVLGGLEVLREFRSATTWYQRGPGGGRGRLDPRCRRAAGRRGCWPAAVALGVASCTRPHLALVVVVVVAAVGVTAGGRRAVAVGGSASVAWVLLIVPFLLGGVGAVLPAARGGEDDRGSQRHARDRRRRAGGGGAAGRRARRGPAVVGVRRGLVLCRRPVRALGAVPGPAAPGRAGRGPRSDPGGGGRAVRPLGDQCAPVGGRPARARPPSARARHGATGSARPRAVAS